MIMFVVKFIKESKMFIQAVNQGLSSYKANLMPIQDQALELWAADTITVARVI